jgi:hypothetical protein
MSLGCLQLNWLLPGTQTCSCLFVEWPSAVQVTQETCMSLFSVTASGISLNRRYSGSKDPMVEPWRAFKQSEVDSRVRSHRVPFEGPRRVQRCSLV